MNRFFQDAEADSERTISPGSEPPMSHGDAPGSAYEVRFGDMEDDSVAVSRPS